MTEKTVLVAFGGVSPEHEVSVLTAMQVMAALKETEYRCLPLYISKNGAWLTGQILTELSNYKDLKTLEAKAVSCTFARDDFGRTVVMETRAGFFRKPAQHVVDVVLTAFHGADGENGAFQGACDVFNLPYTGSGVSGSAVGMDKRLAKDICRTHGIPLVDDIWFSETEWVARREHFLTKAEQLGFPLFVKPIHLGSSIGVTKVDNLQELEQAVEFGFRYDAQLLVEKGISPLTEINCSVLGTYDSQEASVCERPVGASELLSFADKYQNDGGGKGMAAATRIIPADISEHLTQQIQETAKKVFRVLNGSGLARLDFLVKRDTETFYFNEINSIPGSFSFYLWDKSGISFAELLRKLIRIATEEHQQKNGRVRSHETNLLSEKAVKGMKGLKGSK